MGRALLIAPKLKFSTAKSDPFAAINYIASCACSGKAWSEVPCVNC